MYLLESANIKLYNSKLDDILCQPECLMLLGEGNNSTYYFSSILAVKKRLWKYCYLRLSVVSYMYKLN